MTVYDKADLERLTRQYWAGKKSTDWYVANLLPKEMACATSEENRLPSEQCELLVLLVGHSVEPLLQSVWAYKPKQVLLVLNEWYGLGASGHVWGQEVKRLIESLPVPEALPAQPEVLDPPEIIEAGPVEVFQALRRRVSQRRGVVIDVTGAKKNMVVGAYLFAAFANVPVSYVDFDDDKYDKTHNRPYGYACQIGLLKNPYEAFALRDWERVRQLYERYHFREALDLLVGPKDQGGTGTILQAIKEYMSEASVPVMKMAAALDCYKDWDSGDFNSARTKANTISGFCPPTAVTQLGRKWFTVGEKSFQNMPPSFFEDTPDLRIYVYDEIRCIERLAKYNEDYRSAFLRAGGVNEVLMVARLVRLFTDPGDKAALLESLRRAPDKAVPLQSLYKTPSASKLFDPLLRQPGSEIIAKAIFSWAAEVRTTLPETMNRWWTGTSLFNRKDDWKTFLNRRNDLVHTFVSVPESWARGAIEFVEANFEDFIGSPMETLGFQAEILPWPNLCRLCGVDEFLPLNLRETRKEETT